MNCSYKRPWSTSCFYGIVISSEISTCNLLQKNTWWVKLENKWMNEWMTSGHVSLFNISLRWVKESLHWKSGLLWLELLTCVLFTSYTNQGRFIIALMKLKKVLIFCKYCSLSLGAIYLIRQTRYCTQIMLEVILVRYFVTACLCTTLFIQWIVHTKTVKYIQGHTTDLFTEISFPQPM